MNIFFCALAALLAIDALIEKTEKAKITICCAFAGVLAAMLIWNALRMHIG